MSDLRLTRGGGALNDSALGPVTARPEARSWGHSWAPMDGPVGDGTPVCLEAPPTPEHEAGRHADMGMDAPSSTEEGRSETLGHAVTVLTQAALDWWMPRRCTRATPDPSDRSLPSAPEGSNRGPVVRVSAA